MKTITVMIPEGLYYKIRRNLIPKNQTMTSYLQSLICKDIGVEIKANHKTINVRIPENEYWLLKAEVQKQNYTIKSFIETLLADDLKYRQTTQRFENEDNSGCCKTISFQTDENFFNEVKKRCIETGLSFQDYMKTLIYSVTHQAQVEEITETEDLSEDFEMHISM